MTISETSASRACRIGRLGAGAALALIILTVPHFALAKTVCVNTAGSGKCFSTIQAAIDSSTGALVISVAPGTYKENVDISAGRHVTIIGTGGAAATIIDGGGINPVMTAGSKTVVKLTGLTIQHGSSQSGGGGLSFQNGTYKLFNCTITGNQLTLSGARGAGIFASGNLTIENSTISNNTLAQVAQGGGIAASGVVKIIGSTISGNGDPTFYSSGGGGLFYYEQSSSPPPPESDTRSSGTSKSGSLTIERSTFSNNQAAQGGAMYISAGGQTPPLVLVLETTIAGNTAQSGAGIFAFGAQTLLIGQSTVSGNTIVTGGDGFGGGINFQGETLGIGDSTIAANSTFNVGGGIVTDGILTVLANDTIAGNNAGAEGGGIEALGATGAFNTIIANNTSGSGPDCARNLTSDNYNLIGNTSDCTVVLQSHDIVGKDPLLGALANNGGSTQTMALLSGSPAIDAGNPAPPNFTVQQFRAHPGRCIRVDQRGIVRRKGDCDIGAYESQ